MSSEPRKGVSTKVKSRQRTLFQFDCVTASNENNVDEGQSVRPDTAKRSEAIEMVEETPVVNVPSPLLPGLPYRQASPNQPVSFNFPKKTFGNSRKKRSFQPAWFQRYKWLHYVEIKAWPFVTFA